MTRYIAFYLPQYHPIEENDRWFSKGFTEWTNVAKARPLFPGHYEPHIPADLGFYDLRLKETRRNQAVMAEENGISGFCYWYYWFGGGKQLLTMPIWEMYKDKSIRLPFCIAWGNHSWYKKTWDKKGSSELIVEQKYLRKKDYEDFFYTLLPLFEDERYIRVNGKLFFCIYDAIGNSEIRSFISTWRELAIKEGLIGFFFVGEDSACRNKEQILANGFDAVYDNNIINIHHNLPFIIKGSAWVFRNIFRMPTVFRYKKAMKYMITDDAKNRDVIPCIAPNWDHSPRSGRNAIILHDCKPEFFKEVAKKAKDIVSSKPDDERIVLIKSWNEWGEGNHLEPDLKYGKGYLDAIKEIVNNCN